MHRRYEPSSEPTANGVERFAHFGPFKLNLKTGELLREGVSIRLQNKPCQILRALIEHPGCVVTREELRDRLWPKDTFVDFESGLNTAANRLRLALSDSAEHPRYVETLPRVGYRFIEPVRIEEPANVPPRPICISQGEMAQNAAQSGPERVAQTGPPAPGSGRSDVRPLAISQWFSSSRFWKSAGWSALAFLGIAWFLSFFWLHFARTRSAPVFHQLTFRRGVVDNARFTPSGEVVYSAAWDETGRHLYLMDVVSPESRQLEFGKASLVAVSKASEVAFLRSSKVSEDAFPELDGAALHGGAPRPLQRDVLYADSGPDGSFCVIRRRPQGLVVEYPAGKVIYQSSFWLDKPRISPDGNTIAVAEHPLKEDDAGSVLLISRTGKIRHLTGEWDSLRGIAWSGDGEEVWFAAAQHGIDRELYAVTLKGKLRRVAAMPAVLQLFDLAPSGRVLVGRSVPRLSLFVGDLKSLQTRDISWLDFSHLCSISANGNEVLFDEGGEGGGPQYTVYLRRRDRGTTERIAYGRALDLSADGDWALVGDHDPSSKITLFSTEDVKSRVINAPGYIYQTAHFVGRTRDLAVQLTKPGGPEELYLQNIDTGAMRKIPNSAGLGTVFPSPDGHFAVSYLSARQSLLLELGTGQRTSIQSSDPLMPAGWSNDSHLVLAAVRNERVRLETYDCASKQLRALSDLPESAQPNPGEMPQVMVSGDLKSFAFSKSDETINLFAVDGWS